MLYYFISQETNPQTIESIWELCIHRKNNLTLLVTLAISLDSGNTKNP